jgi:hypothetical protein
MALNGARGTTAGRVIANLFGLLLALGLASCDVKRAQQDSSRSVDSAIESTEEVARAAQQKKMAEERRQEAQKKRRQEAKSKRREEAEKKRSLEAERTDKPVDVEGERRVITNETRAPVAVATVNQGSFLSIGKPKPNKPITKFIAVSQTFPAFPWPPDRPSSHTVIPRKGSLARDSKLSLSDVQGLLSDSLRSAGYGQQSYYSAPGGFALVTRLEGIDRNGKPLSDDLRYRLADDKAAFSLATYIKELFLAPDGMYRLLVFVISDESFVTGDSTLSEEKAITLLDQGALSLPVEVFAKIGFSNGHAITALIYEYAVDQSAKEPILILPGRIRPQTHLDKSGISAELIKISS